MLHCSVAATALETCCTLNRTGFLVDFSAPEIRAKLDSMKVADGWAIVKTHETSLERAFSEIPNVLVLPYDMRIADEFSIIGIHNCAWNANPYVPHYATVPDVAYVDMGIESDMTAAKAAFPQARRALMYTPMEIAEKSLEELAADFDRIANEYGPCDLVCADIDLGVPDSRILEILDLCEVLSGKYAEGI